MTVLLTLRSLRVVRAHLYAVLRGMAHQTGRTLNRMALQTAQTENEFDVTNSTSLKTEEYGVTNRTILKTEKNMDFFKGRKKK